MGYRSIMVGTDGSETATRAVRAATTLAKSFMGAQVQIVCAHGAGGVDEEVAKEVLRYAREAVRAQGLETRTHMRAGDPDSVITELAERQGADLIVVGNVGMGKARRFKLGGIAEQVAHGAPCDVLIVHTTEGDERTEPYRRVVIGTDGSATATEAARKGFELAEVTDATVTLVYVGDPLIGAIVLEQTAADRPGSATVNSRVEDGDPAERIVEIAGKDAADLVVVGNKGFAGARRYLLGSIPVKVAHESPTDVLVAKTVGRSIDDLAPGHGGLVDVGGRKLAVYKAEDGSVVALSPRCQHMGCTVDWNDADQTWDCPCHGSRYARDGEVIKGPAKKNLDREELVEPSVG
ncbi:MAG TPA: universal stress protein [Actinomycetota bacterium]|nr:universal stress protein [Actinomycetota bacterium]